MAIRGVCAEGKGLHALQAVDPNACVWGTPTVGMAHPPNFIPTWGSFQSLPDTSPSTPSSGGLHKCQSVVSCSQCCPCLHDDQVAPVTCVTTVWSTSLLRRAFTCHVSDGCQVQVWAV